MKKNIIIGVIALAVIAALYGVITYNRLVTLNTEADAQWKQVEVDYQRRFDLIPNLVSLVKGIMTQEKEIFTAIADARSRYSGAKTTEDRIKSAVEVESALSRLLVITENYPALKSSDSVNTLMSQLEGSENRISVARNRYNDKIKTYNLKVMRFPSSVIASIFNFEERTYFESVEGSEKAPEVKF